MPLVILTVILYSIIIVIAGIFDRYVVFLIPLAMIILTVGNGKFSLIKKKTCYILSGLLVFIYGGFAVAGTHDYLSWNRARWESINYIMIKRNIPYTKIDGGYEFNGWFNYDPDYITTPDKSWWWVKNDEYIISFGPIKGFKIRYKRWLERGEGDIYILKKVFYD